MPHVLHDLGRGNRVVHIPADQVPLPKKELATTCRPLFREYWIFARPEYPL
jgi:hypothetical protein